MNKIKKCFGGWPCCPSFTIFSLRAMWDCIGSTLPTGSNIRSPKRVYVSSRLPCQLLPLGESFFLFWRIARTEKQVMPAISGVILFTNAIWWFLLPPLQAFVWATIFHGIQYLAIVIIFHVRDQLAVPENHHSRTYHICWFYGACILLGYGLFHCFPRAFIFMGFGPVESVLLVVAVINIHHFIVDAFIWRLKKTDSNRKIVESASPVPA